MDPSEIENEGVVEIHLCQVSEQSGSWACGNKA